MWRLWALALGRKEGRNTDDADKIAIIRTLIMLQLVITNGFIIAGNVKNLWGQSSKCHSNIPNVANSPIINR